MPAIHHSSEKRPASEPLQETHAVKKQKLNRPAHETNAETTSLSFPDIEDIQTDAPLQSHPDIGHHPIPPFLFRVASANGSRGLNTKDETDPLFGYDAEYHSSPDDIPPVKRGIMIGHHIGYDYYMPSEFSSWCVSLWFVLVHARRQSHIKCYNRILIYILDTSKLPSSSKIYYAPELLRENGQGQALFYKTKVPLEDLSQGEYLIHGKLNNTNGMWKAIDLESLEDAGLWNYFPSLCNKDKQHMLFWRAEELRGGWFLKTRPLLPHIVQWLRKLARCFGSEWEGIMLLALITLAKRDFEGECLEVLVAELGDLELPRLKAEVYAELPELEILFDELGDGRQLMQVLRLLHERKESEVYMKDEELVRRDSVHDGH